MKVVLIEDEAIAMRMLRNIIQSVNNKIEIVAELESVAEAQLWFQNNSIEDIDIIFSDIQLSDGLSFEIFEKLSIKLPIIFTTAYNEYAIRAFKVNGVDYLLKPIQEADVAQALKKFEQSNVQYNKIQLTDLQQLMRSFQVPPVVINPTFLAYQKDKIVPVQSDNISWINTQNQVVTVVMNNNHKLHLDETLEEIEKRLPTHSFFRANRQYIISRKAVVEAELYFNNRLSVKLNPPAPESVIISREKVSQFRNWLQGLV
jgi:two-component system LytT family response regulator